MIKEAIKDATLDTITDEERQCLRMWFRQAIAQLEQEEVTESIRFELEQSEKAKARHRIPIARRRSRRSRMIPHLRELVF